ncbi:tat (twin-arginine translocation) pathway signal sequence [Pimelobacter simplex]|uniref:Uncharacterized protein n=1 Tax=Nocardioides simplex TaxID=2045 RepID=A0A0A1DIK0_NOCSI|nr:hypothetical protein [Pimelobacter simplex]AIY16378.1 hypothetical protein KR76_05700 [Pimelobacter simplex]MCG8152959.1 tat (twin-arginine translocation) pathway signal sequence [Pimelobacter simplex]GEB11927.1 hypothetical protein NSI01_02420 [Pimelobacter simplex]SFN03453.1 hypothetical protein SAMN05421671_4787 [Pimelobacter simplex]
MTSSRQLTVLGAALVAAVLVAPSLLATLVVGDYSGVGALRDGLPAAFAEHWRLGDGAVSHALGRSADYWATFHLVKAVAAALLLAVLVTALRRGRRRPPVLTAGLLLLTALAVVLVIANLQGAVAPVSSLLSMLPADAVSAAADARGTDAFDGLVHDFAVYHAVVAVLAGGTTIVLAVMGVRAWRRRGRPMAVVAFSAALLLGVVALANVTTTADPEPALVAFLDAGSR